MHPINHNTLVVCFLTATFLIGKVVPSHDEENYEMASNDTLLEMGPADSHEAMNNAGPQPPKNLHREKRSYEFLMGLINNNSKYEVTKVEEQTKQQEKLSKENIEASELLLELMTRIAAHPDHWNKVHQLLQQIDKDLKTSKDIIKTIKASSTPPNPIKKQSSETLPKDISKWPDFQEKATTKAYPKNFAYHRVTGKPIYLNKNPKAYIAVSVIAPKPSTKQEEDLNLENELLQLKPWTHQQNLKNMAKLRSRWVIQTDDNKQKT